MPILPNLTYFGHDGSYYFNDCRRTKHHPMIKQTEPESLDCQENESMVSLVSRRYMRGENGTESLVVGHRSWSILMVNSDI